MVRIMVAVVNAPHNIPCMAEQKARNPRVIFEVTEEEKLDLDALAFLRATPLAQIIRGMVKAELVKHRADIDRAKKMQGSLKR
jgi:hypothetical protein